MQDLTEYMEYFLNSESSVVQLDLIEISHPNFTKVYRKVRNAQDGITVTLETSEVAAFEYAPMVVTASESRDNLDFGFDITFGDLGEILPIEMDAVFSVPGGMLIYPTFKYWTYRSDNLTKPLFGPVVLEITEFSFKGEGATFKATTPPLNVTSTGEIYSLERFPMLKGFL